jgi:amidase
MVFKPRWLTLKAFVRRKAGKEGIDRLFEEQDIDLVVAIGDSGLCMFSSYAGYPVATAPVPSYVHPCGRRYGILIVAQAGQEALLLRFLAAWEAKVGGHPLPQALIDMNQQQKVDRRPAA